MGSERTYEPALVPLLQQPRQGSSSGGSCFGEQLVRVGPGFPDEFRRAGAFVRCGARRGRKPARSFNDSARRRAVRAPRPGRGRNRTSHSRRAQGAQYSAPAWKGNPRCRNHWLAEQVPPVPTRPGLAETGTKSLRWKLRVTSGLPGNMMTP